MWWAWGKGWGPGLTVTMVEGSHVPGSVWPAVVVVCGGRMTGRLVTGILTRVWTGSCWVAVSAVVVGAGGRGARVVVGGGSWLGRGPGRGWYRVVCVVAYAVLCVAAWAPALVWGWVWGWGPVWVWGSGLGLGSGSRLRSTSVRRCEGVDAGLGVVPVGCRGA